MNDTITTTISTFHCGERLVGPTPAATAAAAAAAESNGFGSAAAHELDAIDPKTCLMDCASDRGAQSSHCSDYYSDDFDEEDDENEDDGDLGGRPPEDGKYSTWLRKRPLPASR